jgi:hypothetical protein
MVTLAPTRTDLHSFKLAHPIVRTTSRFDLTALAVLSMTAITIWLLVLPAEFALRLAM